MPLTTPNTTLRFNVATTMHGKVHSLSIVTLALGLRPKQGLAKARAKREARESHFMLPGVQESVRE
jgi:hypothetical protein